MVFLERVSAVSDCADTLEISKCWTPRLGPERITYLEGVGTASELLAQLGNTWALKGVGARQHLQQLGVGADCANTQRTNVTHCTCRNLLDRTR